MSFEDGRGLSSHCEIIRLVSGMALVRPAQFVTIGFASLNKPWPHRIRSDVTPPELELLLQENLLTKFIIACRQDDLFVIAPLIRNRSIDQIFVLMNNEEGFFPFELLDHPGITEIENERKFKRYLLTNGNALLS